MMKRQNHISHTEIEYPSSNAMEQAALLKTRCALARWRSSDELYTTGGGAACSSAREHWYAEQERQLHEWIAHGGLAQEEDEDCSYGTAPCLQACGLGN